MWFFFLRRQLASLKILFLSKRFNYTFGYKPVFLHQSIGWNLYLFPSPSQKRIDLLPPVLLASAMKHVLVDVWWGQTCPQLAGAAGAAFHFVSQYFHSNQLYMGHVIQQKAPEGLLHVGRCVCTTTASSPMMEAWDRVVRWRSRVSGVQPAAFLRLIAILV